MQAFPHQHRTTISRTLPSRARIESQPMKPLEAGPSPHFDGDATMWSAEQLMLSAIGTCLLTTFEAFAARDRIKVLDWRATANGTVERTTEGLQFTSIVLSLDIQIDGNVAGVEQTLEDAKQYCLLLSALRVPVVIETQIRDAEGQPVPAPAARPSTLQLMPVNDDWSPSMEEPILAAS